MSSCTYYHELISRMLDDDLTKEESRVLALHIRNCDECAAVYEAFSGISAMLEDDIQNPPERMSENVMASIRRDIIENREKDKRKSEKGKGVRLRAVFLVAACMAVAFIAGSFVQSMRSEKVAMSSQSAPAAVYEEAAPYESDEVPAEPAASSENAVSPGSEAYVKIDSGVDITSPASAFAPSYQAVIDNAADEETVIANVSRIDILYGGAPIEEFTFYVGDSALKLTSDIFPLSVKGNAKWSSSDESVLKVTDNGDGSCYVSPVSDGTARAIAEYAGFSNSCTVRVVDEFGEAGKGIAICCFGSRVRDFTVHVGDAQTILSVGLEVYTDDEVKWECSDSSVIRITPYGEYGLSVVPVGTGTAVITVRYGEKISACTVRVLE